MSTSQMRKERMINELSIIESTIHPNVARIYELLHTQTHFYIVSEYIKTGDFAQICTNIARNKKGLMEEKDVKRIAMQLFGALNYIHESNIVHRDIKLDNILYDQKINQIKIIDFGFAENIKKNKGFLNHRLGSTRYVAPEILQKRPYDYLVDVWSATIVIYVLLTGKMPYNGKDFTQMKKLIQNNDLDL